MNALPPHTLPPGNPYSPIPGVGLDVPSSGKPSLSAQAGWYTLLQCSPRHPGIGARADPAPCSVHASVALQPHLWPGCGRALTPLQAEPQCGSQRPACWTPCTDESGLVSSQADGLTHPARPLPYHAVQTSNSLLRLYLRHSAWPLCPWRQPSVLRLSPSTALRLHD